MLAGLRLRIRRKIRKELLKKTETLIRENVELLQIVDELPLYEINKDIANVIRSDNIPDRVKVINLQRFIKIHRIEDRGVIPGQKLFGDDQNFW